MSLFQQPANYYKNRGIIAKPIALVNVFLATPGNAYPVTVCKNRTMAAQGRNRSARLAAESDHDGIINNPVAAG